eukprot:gene28741-31919_t
MADSIDHLQQGNTRLDRVSFIVLDEADRMLTWDSSRRSKRQHQADRVSFIVLDEADRMLTWDFEPQIKEATPGWDRVSFIVLDED